jgi:hypothetical protein
LGGVSTINTFVVGSYISSLIVLMKMLAFISVLALLCAGIRAQEMAVLLGGYNTDEQNTHSKPVDVYTKHLEASARLCEETGSEPTIPDLPFGTSKHNAIFLPNSGIYVCGWLGDLSQQSSECWNYDPRIKRYTFFYHEFGSMVHYAKIFH